MPARNGRARHLTPLEKRYLQGKLRVLDMGRQLTMALSALFVLLGVGCFIAPFADDMQAPTEILFLIGMGLLLGVGGTWLFHTAHRRRFTADAHTTELIGAMTEQVVRVTHPRSGARQTMRSYHVDGTQLLLPFGGDVVCQRLVDQPVRAVVALVHKSNPVQGLGEGSVLHERASDAVLLELDGHIHIDHVLSTYGPRYFQRRQLRETVVVGLAMSMTFLPAGWLVWHGVSPTTEALTSWWGVALTFLAAIVLALLWGWLYDAIERRVAPLPDQLSHEERLRHPS